MYGLVGQRWRSLWEHLASQVLLHMLLCKISNITLLQAPSVVANYTSIEQQAPLVTKSVVTRSISFLLNTSCRSLALEVWRWRFFFEHRSFSSRIENEPSFTDTKTRFTDEGEIIIVNYPKETLACKIWVRWLPFQGSWLKSPPWWQWEELAILKHRL